MNHFRCENKLKQGFSTSTSTSNYFQIRRILRYIILYDDTQMIMFLVLCER